MTRTIQKYGLSCLVFIVVFCLIYFTTQAMKMAEQDISPKTKCNPFSKRFVQFSLLLAQNEM